MNLDDLLRLVALSEDSGRQFKTDVTNADSLAADFAGLRGLFLLHRLRFGSGAPSKERRNDGSGRSERHSVAVGHIPSGRFVGHCGHLDMTED